MNGINHRYRGQKNGFHIDISGGGGEYLLNTIAIRFDNDTFERYRGRLDCWLMNDNGRTIRMGLKRRIYDG